MKKRVFLVAAIVGLLALTGAVLLHGKKERAQFQGKSVAEWSLAAYGGDTNATAALKKLAPGSVALLINLTEYGEPVWRQKLRAVVLKSPRFVRSRFATRLAMPNIWLIRISAVHSLGLIGTEARQAIPALERIMIKVPNEVRGEAARSLGRIGKDSLPVLMSALRDGEPSVQFAAMTGLGEVGEDAAAAIQLMLPFLEHPDGNTRLLAGYNLERIGPAALFAVIELQASGDEKKRQAVIEYFGRQVISTRSPGVVLRELASGPSPEMRRRAFESLGKLRPATAFNVRLLIAGLKDSVPQTRLAAVRGLGNIGSRAAIALPELHNLLNDSDPTLRGDVEGAINSIEAATLAQKTLQTN